ncbi:MAG TPA: DUF4232 domain-containing protein [Ktedonobacterales bacterium]
MPDGRWSRSAAHAGFVRAALAALVAGALAGCATPTTDQGTTTALVPTNPTMTTPPGKLGRAATTTPEPSPTIVVIVGAPGAFGPTCLPSQLTLTVIFAGAAGGSAAEEAMFTNHAQAACSLNGFPTPQFLDGQRNAMAAQIEYTEQGMWSGTVPIQPVQLAPGASAYFMMFGSDGQTGTLTTCFTPTYLAVTPPNVYGAITIPSKVAACDGRLFISPVEPSMATFHGG